MRYQRVRQIVEKDLPQLKLRAAIAFLKQLESMTVEDVLFKMDCGRVKYGGDFDMGPKVIRKEFEEECVDAVAYQAMADERHIRVD